MPLLTCVVYIVLLVVIAGVLVWALKSLPLDPTVQQIGRVAIIVVFVIVLVLVMLNCIGLGTHWPAIRP